MTFTPRVLVVDDDALMMELLTEGLVRARTEPRCVQSSVEAAKIINREKFDGIFLDWIMPELDGLELAKQVRWSKSNSLCPIVMITGNANPEAMRECFHAGINFFLQKPVSLEQIQNVAERAHDLMLQEWLRYQRVPVRVPVLCTYQIQSLSQKAEGESIDLSTTGMRLRLNPTPSPGSTLQLKFRLPGESAPLALAAVVVRLASDQQVGVRLINLTAEERWRLVHFSKTYLETK
jgi:CheY-like chemotaxis protein